MTDLVLIRARNNASRRIRYGHSSRKGGSYFPPYPILWIKDFVMKAGYSVAILDCFRPEFSTMDAKEIARRAAQLSPSLIGISALTSQSVDAIAIAAAIKAISPVPVIFGGPHFSALPQQALAHGDAVVIGEGEKAVVNILKKPGEINNVTIEGMPLSQSEMDSLSFLSRKDLNSTAFSQGLSKEFGILTARGCPYNCVFCKDTSRSAPPRYHSAEYVVDMLDFTVREFSVRKFFIMDDVFAGSLERLDAIASGLSGKKLQLEFTCFLHSNMIRKEILNILKNIGVKRIKIGIESGNNDILALIRKNTTIENLKKSVEFCKRNGFEVGTMFMLGNIGETCTTMKESIRFAYSLPSDHDWFSFANPFPGTRFYGLVPEYGTVIEPDFGKWNNRELVYLPKGVSRRQMKRLMVRAQIERGIKLFRSILRKWAKKVCLQRESGNE